MSSRPRVAFQGERGAYSEQAALALLGREIELVPLSTFDAVFAEVQQSTCDYGVVPIENSLAGSIHRNYDLLLRHDLYITAEHNARLHCLIVHPASTIRDPSGYSHPGVGVRASLPELECGAAHDTAGGVRLIRAGLRDGHHEETATSTGMSSVVIWRRKMTHASCWAGGYPRWAEQNFLAFAGKNRGCCSAA